MFDSTKKAIAATVVLCWCSVVIAQDLGKNFARNLSLLEDVTSRVPKRLYDALARNDVREELRLSPKQVEGIQTLISNRESFVSMRLKVDGTDGSNAAFGNLTESEMNDLREEVRKLIDANRDELHRSLEELLKESQSKRLSQILIQERLLRKSERYIPAHTHKKSPGLNNESRTE